MSREVISPFSDDNNNEQTVANFVTTASTPVSQRPLSPMSKEPMQEVLCGTADGPNFKVWVSLKDRLVIPYMG